MSKNKKKVIPANARKGVITQTAQELQDEKKYLEQELQQNKAAYEGNIKNQPKTVVSAERLIKKIKLQIAGIERVTPTYKYEQNPEYIELEKENLLELHDKAIN